MSERSTPITIAGKDYELRFEPEDVENCEMELGIGYIFFFKVENKVPVYLSLKLCKSLIHRGLKTADTRGDLHYVFPQTPAGAKEAGEIIQKAMQEDGSTLFEIWGKSQLEFVNGWYPKSKPDDKPAPPSKEITSKNSRKTGSKQRDQSRMDSAT